jgi:hypothetical protein
MSITSSATSVKLVERSVRLVERKISQLANENSYRNLPLSNITQILLLGRVLRNPPRNGAELVAYWQREGVINSRPDISDSQAYARQLRHEAETRTKE